MHTHQALDGRVQVFKPADRLIGGPETDEIVRTAKQFAAQGGRGLLVDLEDVGYISSIGLGAFTRLVTTYALVNGNVKVCNVKGRVRKLFDIVRFHVLFEYYDSENAALAAFEKELAHTV